MKDNQLLSTEAECVHIWGNDEPLDFDGEHTWVKLKRSEIEFFNNNPNDNLCLNMEYYKSLHWYKWNLQFNYKDIDDTGGTVNIHNDSGKFVFVF